MGRAFLLIRYLYGIWSGFTDNILNNDWINSLIQSLKERGI